MTRIIILFLLFTSFQMNAQIPEPINNIMDEFFNQIDKNQPKDAAKILKESNPALKRDLNITFEIAEVFRTIIRRGRNEFEFAMVLDSKFLGENSLLRISYLMEFTEHPVMFEVYFYESQDTWRFIKYSYTTDVEEIYEIIEEYEDND